MRAPLMVRAVRLPVWRLRQWLPAALLATLGGTVWAVQPPSPAAPAPAGLPPMATGTAPAQPAKPEQTFSQKFDRASWDTVFNWFNGISGLNQITTFKPTSTVTLTIKDKPLGQVIDLLNEALANEKFVLIRREQSYTIRPADEKIPPELVPFVPLDQVSRRGVSEVIQVIYPLKTLQPEVIVPQLKKSGMLSNFGDVNPLGTNISIVDKAGNVRNVISYLKQQEDGTGPSDSLTYHCKYQRASKVADSLRNLLTDSDTQVTSTTPQAIPGAPGSFQQNFQFAQPQFDSRRGGSMPAASGRFRNVNIAVQEESNTIVITGPADKLSVAEKLLKELDVGAAGNERIKGGQPESKIYDVPSGTADVMATTLKEVYKSSAITQIRPLPGGSQIFVYALPADHFDISAQLKGPSGGTPSTVTELVPLNLLDPTATAKSVQTMMGGPTGGFYVEARTDGAATGLLLRGSPGQVADAKAILKTLGEDPGVAAAAAPGGQSRMRIITIEKGNASVAADVLADMLRKMGRPAQVIGGNPPPAPKKEPEKSAPPAKEPPKAGMPRIGYEFVAAQAPPGGLADPQANQVPPGKGGVTITVTPGNKIILTGDDPAALNDAAYLLRLLISPGSGDEFRTDVIRLKYVSAEEAAKVISEVFNGPAQPAAGRPGGGRGGPGGGFNPLAMIAQFAGVGAAAPTNPSDGRVRVVADKNSNSLIVVKASALDLATIRLLLEKAIDNGESPEGTPRVWTIPLRYARADAVASTVKEVLRNYTGTGQQRGGGR